MMMPLHRSFEAEGDEQADGDGHEMQDEVAEAVHPLVGWMDIEHGILRTCEDRIAASRPEACAPRNVVPFQRLRGLV